MRWLRRLVSTNKRRYQNGQYDLDLSFILGTRIVAMGFPSQQLRSIVRNPLVEVRALLSSLYDLSDVCVFNLCIEPGWQYPHSALGMAVVEVPLWDGQAPPLHIMQSFCVQATEWLAAHPQGCVVVHCKAGKGRTGALVAALLLHLVAHAPHLAPDLVSQITDISHDTAGHLAGSPLPLPQQQALRALHWWGERRTVDGKGLTISSQRRYVSYYASLLTNGWANTSAPWIRLLEVRVQEMCARHTVRPVGCYPSSTTSLDTAGATSPRWQVPALTVAVWVRPPLEHTPKLLAYGVLPAGVYSSNSSDRDGALVDNPCPGVTATVQAAACRPSATTNDPDKGSDHQLAQGLSPTAAHTAGVMNNAQWPGAVGCRLAVCEDGSLSLRLPASAPAGMSTTVGGGATPGTMGVEVQGDIKIQVFTGCRRPSSAAVFAGRGSLFLTWVNTAFLSEHDVHWKVSRRPDSHAAPDGPSQQVGPCGPVDSDAAVGSACQSVVVQRAELDKVAKNLRRSERAVSVQLLYTDTKRSVVD